MVDVEILGQVITHQYGTLKTGDVLRTSAEFAKHLVEDCGAAKYCKQATADTAPETSGEPAAMDPSASADPVDLPPVNPASTRGRRTK